MSATTVNAVEIPFTVTGSGPALLLVPGTGPTAQIQFGSLMEELATYRTVISPDLSGSDAVDDDGSDLTVEQLVEQLAAVLDAAGVENASLLGFSLGSPVAVQFAATHPERVDQLVLIAGWVSTQADEYLRNFFTVWRELAAGDADIFGRFSTFTGFSVGFLNGLGAEAVEAMIPNLKPNPNLNRQIDLGARIDIRDCLDKVSAQTLVVACAHDATIPPSSSTLLANSIPGAHLRSIESGHVAPLENPSALLATVRDFLV